MASIAADKWLIPITPCPPAAPGPERTCEDGAVQIKKLQMCNYSKTLEAMLETG